MIVKAQKMYADNMFVAGIPFLVSVTKPLNLITATPLGKSIGARSVATLREAINQQINVYKKYGFTIDEFHSDAESGFAAQQQWFAEQGVKYVPNSEDVKVGIVENCIKRIKNTARCILHSVPYHLSRILLVWLVCYAVQCLNLQTSRTGREGLCPRQELTGIRPDVKRDVRAAYGDFVQFFNKEAGNTMNARTSSGIVLLASGNQNGGLIIMNLFTGKTNTRQQVIIMPIPREYVNMLNEWAKLKAELPDGLSSNWGHYLTTEDGEEGPDIDRSFAEILRKYAVPMVNIDASRVPQPMNFFLNLVTHP
jgi:hypothetical protein